MSKGCGVETGRRVPSRRAFGLVVGALALAGCGAPPPQTFDLSAVRFASAGRAHGQLLIAVPLASSPADSDRIAVRPTPDTVATLKGAQWSESLPTLVQTRLVQSFENGRFLQSVARAGSGVEAPRTLTSEIRRFEIDVPSGQAVVEIAVKLVDGAAGRIVAAQVFTAQVPGTAASGAAATAALDEALGDVMRQIVAWTAKRV